MNFSLSNMHRIAFALILTLMAGMLFQQPVNALSDKEKESITTGLVVGEKIAELFEKREFIESLTKIGQSIAPYLGALGPFISLVLAFIPGSESAELQFMKEMMNKIDTRFDRLDSRFNDVERLINWNVVQVNFGQIEQKILAMSEEYQLLYSAPPLAVENRRKLFTSVYESDYQNSGYKLYQALVKTSGTFQGNIGASVMHFTENDRKKTQGFLLGALQLLFQAVKIELTYLQVKNYVHNAELMRNEWEERIIEVQNQLESIDREVTLKYHDQSKIDIKRLAAEYSKMSNKEFSTSLYDMLATKYYWRDWLTVVYNPITGGEVHWIMQCGGHHLFRQNGKNIVVASLRKDTSSMDPAVQVQRIAKARQSFNKNWAADAHEIFDQIPSQGACSIGVIFYNNAVYYKSGSRTFTHEVLAPNFVIYPKYDVHIWG